MARPRSKAQHLPLYVYEHHGSYWYRPPGQKPARLAVIPRLEEANEKLAQLGGTTRVMDVRQLGALLTQARVNAKTRGLVFELTRADVDVLWQRSGGRCELTGIPFESIRLSSRKRRPWMASIDRIDSALGYTPANVRLVCWAVNWALSDWGEEVFGKIARAYVRFSPVRIGRLTETPK